MATRRSAGGRAPQAGVAQRRGRRPGRRGRARCGRPCTGDAELVAVVDHLVERERRGDDAAVELGDGDAGGDVVRAEPGVGRPATVGDDWPDDGAWMIGTSRAASAAGVPRRRRRARRRRRSMPAPAATPPGGQHRGDDHVDGRRSREQRRRPVAPAVAAQRVAPDGQGVGAAGLDGVAQVVDELGVPGHEVGPVEDDADRAAVVGSRVGGRPPDAVVGRSSRAGRSRSPRAGRCRRRSAGGGRGSPDRRARGRRTPR